MKLGRREAFLIAIAKARKWVDDLARGRAASFVVIARQEGKVERHIRLLAPLAFVSPRIVSALLDGTGARPISPLLSSLALPYSWAEVEAWAKHQPDLRPRSEALRRLVEIALKLSR